MVVKTHDAKTIYVADNGSLHTVSLKELHNLMIDGKTPAPTKWVNGLAPFGKLHRRAFHFAVVIALF